MGYVKVLCMCLQGALRPEGDAIAVGARVVTPLQVHQIDVCRQAALGRRRQGSRGTRARAASRAPS